MTSPPGSSRSPRARASSVGVNEIDELSTPVQPSHVLSVYGADHPGIVHAVAAALAERGIEHHRHADPPHRRGGSPVYVMSLELAVRGEAGDLAAALEAVGREAWRWRSACASSPAKTSEMTEDGRPGGPALPGPGRSSRCARRRRRPERERGRRPTWSRRWLLRPLRRDRRAADRRAVRVCVVDVSGPPEGRNRQRPADPRQPADTSSRAAPRSPARAASASPT